MYVIISNGGNESVALIQWAIEQKLSDTHVVAVNTGWGAPKWVERMEHLLAWVEQSGIQSVLLTPPLQFSDLVLDRHAFPSQKFQWCAGLLKGVPILTWLDEKDPLIKATIMIGHRRDTSRAHFNLPEWIEISDRYGDRRVWHPLVAETQIQAKMRVMKTPLAWLNTRALECDPCIHCAAFELFQIAPENVRHTTALEEKLGAPMFASDVYGNAQTLEEFQCIQPRSVESESIDLSRIDMGCGSPYGCGT